MSGKAKLYSDEASWRAGVSSVESTLGLPSGLTANYARDPMEITNEESSDHGKLALPVKTRGTWKCDQLFDPSELVDWDSSWFDDNPPE